MRTILVVGGGYAGVSTAWKLEKKLRWDDPRVVLVDPRPYMTCQPFLPEASALDQSGPVPDAWGAGDDAAVPDLAAARPDVATVPNAQHAVRQGKLLARNIVAALRVRSANPYVHNSLGAVATLGRGNFWFRGIVVRGLLAWLMHPGYHVFAVPSWEGKVRMLAIWLTAAVFGRDIISLASVQDPRHAFPTEGEADRPEHARPA